MTCSVCVNAKGVSDSSKIVKVIIMNDNYSRPIAGTINDFWQSKRLNFITFPGSLYFDLISYRLSKNKIDSVFSDFSIEAAIILTENNKSDTLYTDNFFENWMIKGTTSVTPDRFLRNMFRPLYLGQYRNMRKGEN